uniref:Uncharacterized protein n=1 Tax=Steinernema glaseri TaxID=37863 RepID=A0A1I7YEB8_9BILA
MFCSDGNPNIEGIWHRRTVLLGRSYFGSFQMSLSILGVLASVEPARRCLVSSEDDASFEKDMYIRSGVCTCSGSSFHTGLGSYSVFLVTSASFCCGKHKKGQEGQEKGYVPPGFELGPKDCHSI